MTTTSQDHDALITIKQMMVNILEVLKERKDEFCSLQDRISTAEKALAKVDASLVSTGEHVDNIWAAIAELRLADAELRRELTRQDDALRKELATKLNATTLTIWVALTGVITGLLYFLIHAITGG